MSKINNFLVISSLKSNLKKYKSVLAFSFIVGVIIGTTPYIYKSIDNFRNEKLIKEQQKIQIQNKEKMCKNNNSDYKKFLNLGFPYTAIKKFNICMQEK
tara:strand:+ start:50 stop:346 length:297 start_codon:yes stop_codon:yes gene_type:complete